MPAWALAATQATQTRLAADTRDQAGHTRAALSIAVAGDDGLLASGAVTIEDEGKPLAGLALKADGTAQVTLELPAGAHDLRAVYSGDTGHSGSISDRAAVTAQASSTPDFGIAVDPATLSLTA